MAVFGLLKKFSNDWFSQTRANIRLLVPSKFRKLLKLLALKKLVRARNCARAWSHLKISIPPLQKKGVYEPKSNLLKFCHNKPNKPKMWSWQLLCLNKPKMTKFWFRINHSQFWAILKFWKMAKNDISKMVKKLVKRSCQLQNFCIFSKFGHTWVTYLGLSKIE